MEQVYFSSCLKLARHGSIGQLMKAVAATVLPESGAAGLGTGLTHFIGKFRADIFGCRVTDRKQSGNASKKQEQQSLRSYWQPQTISQIGSNRHSHNKLICCLSYCAIVARVQVSLGESGPRWPLYSLTSKFESAKRRLKLVESWLRGVLR